MPTKVAVNKSQEIRTLHRSGVTSVKEIVAKLHTRGIKVVPTQVYQALKSKNKKRRLKSMGAKSTNGAPTTVLDTAIVFIRQAGGMGNAKELLAKLSLIQN